MSEIKIYTLPTCPKCKILKKKLDTAMIHYVVCEDQKEILEVIKKYNLPSEVPILELDGKKALNFVQAVGWISEQEEKYG